MSCCHCGHQTVSKSVTECWLSEDELSCGFLSHNSNYICRDLNKIPLDGEYVFVCMYMYVYTVHINMCVLNIIVGFRITVGFQKSAGARIIVQFWIIVGFR
jgi:hypothetical protein